MSHSRTSLLSRRFPRRRVRCIAVWGLGLYLAAGLMVVADTARAADTPTNVLVILIDALRPDHLGVYGYERPTSPTIDRLAAEGVLFESAFSQASWTKPSVPSLFTGLYPIEHRVFTGSDEERPGRITSDVLAEKHTTIAEVFQAQGYRTAAFLDNAQLRDFLGFAQGFETYEEDLGRAEAITSRFVDWLRELDEEPFFAYVHYLDPHWPYDPPAPYDQLFPKPTGTSIDFGTLNWKHLERQIEDGRMIPNADDLAALQALYDGEIRYNDQAIGSLLDALREHDLLKSTLIVLTADHGEEFWEHGRLGHGRSLYDEVLHVPLILRLPGGVPARIADQVELVDVMPTLLDLSGIPIPEDLSGKSLRPLVTGESWDERPAFADHRPEGLAGRIQQSVRLPAEKLVRTFTIRGVEPPEEPPLSLPILKPGQWLEVEGAPQGEGRLLALEIEPTEPLDKIKVYGPIQSLGPTPGSFWLLGVLCRVLPETRFKDLAEETVEPYPLSEGLWVQARGNREPSGTFEVERIKLIDPRDSEEEIKAPLESIVVEDDEALMELGGLRVTIDDETEFDGEWDWPDEDRAGGSGSAAEGGAESSASSGASGAGGHPQALGERLMLAVELYDLRQDPGEQMNIAEQRPERVTALLELLDGWEQLHDRPTQDTPRQVLDEATIERLRSLGYLR